MKKKLLAFTVVAALLISVLSMGSVFAATEPNWTWYPVEDGHAVNFGACTSEESEDGTYMTFSTVLDSAEGFAYPGTDGPADPITGNLTTSNMGPIDTKTTKVALIKYRTTAEDKVYGEFVWHNGTEHGFREFSYVNDGEWNFAVVDMETDSSGGAWAGIDEMAWFRFDFANNISKDVVYSVDIAYIAMFANEADARAYAETEGDAVVPDPGDKEDGDKEDGDQDETTPPQTGDVSLIVAVAAAGFVLTIVLRKKLTV